MAAVRVVLPWSMWPIVPTLTWVLVRSNFCFAMFSCSFPGRGPTPALLPKHGAPAPCGAVSPVARAWGPLPRAGPCCRGCLLSSFGGRAPSGASCRLFAADSGHDLAGDRPGHFLVGVELHRVRRATLGARAQVGSVAEHLRQRHLRSDDLAGASLLHPFHLPAPAGEVADDITHVVLGGDDLDRHDGLEQHRLGRAGRLLERERARDLERHLRAVDLVVGAVGEGHAYVDRRIAGQQAALHGLLYVRVARMVVLIGDDAAGDLVDELVTAARAGRLERDDDMAVLAAAAGLAHVALLDLLDLLADRLAIGNLRLANVGIELELAQHAIDEHLAVELAHARDDRLARVVVGVNLERRVLFGQ